MRTVRWIASWHSSATARFKDTQEGSSRRRFNMEWRKKKKSSSTWSWSSLSRQSRLHETRAAGDADASSRFNDNETEEEIRRDSTRTRHPLTVQRRENDRDGYARTKDDRARRCYSAYQSERSTWERYWACEVSISSARASVMVYDDVNKKWIPSGSSSGLSKVQLYHHQLNNTFRVVGRKLQDHEIVINCAILKGLKYNQATGTFHQWRDNKQVYGLNFSSKDDADAFARAMLQALDVLSNGSNISRSLGPAVAPNTQQQPVYQQQQLQQQQQQQQQSQQPTNAQYEEDMGYSQGHSTRVSLSLGHLPAGGQTGLSVGPPTPTPSHHPSVSNAATTVIQVGCSRGSPAEGHMRTMTREDVAIIQERRMSQQSQATNSPNAISPSCPPIPQQQQQQQPPSGHHRTSSAPPAPQPQQQQQQPTAMQGIQTAIIPSAPQMPGGSGPPVPPPQPSIAPCPPTMINFNAPVPPPPMMMNQYAQSPSSQSNISTQPQPQSIYAANQGNQYGTAPSNNQYTNPVAATATATGVVVGQSPNQYASGQNNFHANNGQVNNVYASSQPGLPGPASQNSQYAVGNNQPPQYATGGSNNNTSGGGTSGGSQYGSSNSISQYAGGPASAANQYAVTQQSQSQYGVVSQAQTQYSTGQVQASASSTNPYGTPSNSVNQYASGGHHTVSANTYNPVGSAGPPPPPMVPLSGPAAPPPPPPPPAPNVNSANITSTNSTTTSSNACSDPPPDANSLAAALQAARLKKKQQTQPVENSGSSTSSSGSGGGSGNYGTLGRGGGGSMASMMDEMAKTLARRRAAVEKKQPEQPPEPESSPDKKSWDKSNSSNNKFSNGAESPKSVRIRFGSASEDTLLKVNWVNDGAPLTTQEMESFKTEIIKAVRKEFHKMKQEIIDALKAELSRR